MIVSDLGGVRWSDWFSQPAGPPHELLFTKPAKQCFSTTTNLPEQCFLAKFQTSERGQL